MILIITLIGILCLGLGYLFYGRFLGRYFRLDDSQPTPAVTINDGVDYVPAKAQFLLGQHFSAISAAGPIVGPILAGLWFGWLPAFIWIILGAIFIGGVHDFTSLIASVRHRAQSIGEVVKQHISPLGFILFLCFVWFTLIYVIIAFTDITAGTFKAVLAEQAYGPGVAASSLMYLLLGVIMGLCLRFLKMRLWPATAIFVPLVLFVIWLGPKLPGNILAMLAGITGTQWDILLLVYCFVAAIMPMWLLLQPRGYLGGWCLYGTILAAVIGILFGGFQAQYPAINMTGLKSLVNGQSLFPILFITVACGACSGFHAIVSSGTTSKQIVKETDTKIVGYGSMLLEGVVAILALTTLMVFAPADLKQGGDPNTIYARGIAGYLEVMGLDFNLMLGFALLAFSTFIFDTLDVCTRLGRYVFQELVGWNGKGAHYGATLATLILPLIFLVLIPGKAYLVAWPIFGTSNQLLASLTLLGISMWLWRKGKNPLVTLVPMGFMLVMTFWSLILLFKPGLQDIFQGQTLSPQGWVMTVGSGILILLAVGLVLETIRVILTKGISRPSQGAVGI